MDGIRWVRWIIFMSIVYKIFYIYIDPKIFNVLLYLKSSHLKIMNMKNYLLALTVFSFAVITGCKKNNEELAITNDISVTPEVAFTSVPGQFVPNELLVKFKQGSSEKSRTQTLSFINGSVTEHILTKTMQLTGDNEGIYLVNTATDIFAAMARMKGESNIQYAEPNWVYTHQDVSNDPYFINNSLWGMNGTYGSNAYKAWASPNNHTGSNLIDVGVIDEGIQYTHPDLTANIWINPYEISNGIDDDNNGYVDDIHGWDFVNNDSSIYDGGTRGRLDQHGTHVSGTIGGVGGNATGVVGINWHVKIISAKFLGRNGGTTANAIKAVDYLTGLKTLHPELDIVATNNSWGGGGFSQGLLDAIARGANKNILFIAAAGNNSSNNDVTDNYPSNYNTNGITVSNGTCNYDAVIAVAALVDDGSLAYYSNYGATKVDLGAPGSGIYSTLPPNTYGSYSGTSMATPHVTGGAALYAATHVARGSALRSAIITSVTPTSSISATGSTPTATGGRLNVGGF